MKVSPRWLLLPLLCAQGAWAQTLVITVAPDSDALRRAAPSATAVAEGLRRQGTTLVGTADALARIEASAPLARAEGAPLMPLITDARRRFYYRQDAPAAIALLERVRQETTRCDEYRTASLLLVSVYFSLKKADEVRRILEALGRSDPEVHLAPADFPPPLRAIWHEVRARLRGARRVALTVVGRPAGIRVHVGRCFQGPAPLHVPALLEGTYDVWPEGGRVHRVTLSGGSATLDFDRDFDVALRGAPALGLVGADAARLPTFAAALGRLVNVAEVVLVEESPEGLRLRAVRVVDGAVVREARGKRGALDALVTALLRPLSAREQTREVSRPWYRRWWVWALVGGAVAGGIAAGSLGLRGTTAPSIIVRGSAPP